MSRRRHHRMLATSTKNQGVTSLVRRNQAKRSIVWSCRVISAVVFVAMFCKLRGGSSPSESTNINTMQSTNDDNTTLMIHYELEETGQTHTGLNFQRYSAFDSTTNQPISVQEWTQLLVANDKNADIFTSILKKAPYKSFYLETRGVSSLSIDKDFEFVVVEAPHLTSFAESNPDPHSFAQHFETSCPDKDVCAFPNLGGDAMLVSPIQIDKSIPLTTYSHLAQFVRNAPSLQVRNLWQLTARTYRERFLRDKSPVWLSTEGSGVAWLHVRLDSRPKYYHYKPFANEMS